MKRIPIKHGHFFCGSAGGAKGFNRGSARVGNLEAEFVCVGGIDNDPSAIHDFDRESGCKGTVMDLFTFQQYTAFHGHEPPPGWREATSDDIRAAFHFQRPDIGFTSSPCKGLSGLLNETLSKTAKYQALNELTLRGIWLMCETWKDDPVPLILFENVPRIASRGRHLLDQIGALLRHYGYAVAETTHDCGELGGLGQSRKRFLLVARHIEKVPPFLFEPPKRPLRSVGEVLGRIPLPGDPAAGPMHRMDEIAAMPAANDKLVAIIRALDGTWHRPMTTLDMAALQSYYDPDDYAEGGVFNMYGNNDESKRERIGNMVPPAAAKAIADVMGLTLLLARSGETFALGSTPIWVRPVAIALSVAQGEHHG